MIFVDLRLDLLCPGKTLELKAGRLCFADGSGKPNKKKCKKNPRPILEGEEKCLPALKPLTIKKKQ